MKYSIYNKGQSQREKTRLSDIEYKPKIYTIEGINCSKNIESKYFIIDLTILPKKNVKYIKTGYSCFYKKYYIKIKYNKKIFSYKFYQKDDLERKQVLNSLLYCLNRA